MSRAFAGIGITTLLFACVVFFISWLSNRRSLIFRIVGAVLSGALTIYCLIVAVAVIAEIWQGAPSSSSMLVVLVFAATAVASVYAAFRGFRPRSNRPHAPKPGTWTQ